MSPLFFLRSTIIVVPAALLFGCEESPKSISLSDIIGTELVGSTSAQCPCAGSELVTLQTSAKNAVEITVAETQSSSSGLSTSKLLKFILGGSFGNTLPLGCRVGNLVDPATAPTDAEKQCSKTTAYVVTDKKKYTAPSTLVAGFSVQEETTARQFDANDTAAIAQCVSSCVAGDFTQCLPLGSGFPQLYDTVSDLYNSAALGGYDYIPNPTALSAFGLSVKDVSPACERTSTRVSAGLVSNQSLHMFANSFQCRLSSQLAKSSGISVNAWLPAFEVLLPNYYEASIVSGVSISDPASTAPPVVTSVLKSRDINTSLAINFASPAYTTAGGKSAPTFSGAIRTITKYEDLLVLETDEGCLSLDP